jgi:hypothetical protein
VDGGVQVTDVQELLLTVAILLVAFLAAPLVIDQIPQLSALATWVKIVLCFAFSGAVFVLTILVLAGVMGLARLFRKR